MQHLRRKRLYQGEKVIIDGEELARLIERYVNGPKAMRNRAILREYYLHGKTYEQVAEEFGMSAVHVGRIVHRYGDPLLLMVRPKC